MSNCYDIEIKMNYFDECDSYEDMLEKRKEFFDKAKEIMNYFNKISKSEKAYYSKHEFSFPGEVNLHGHLKRLDQFRRRLRNGTVS